jgi:hypothetical protein
MRLPIITVFLSCFVATAAQGQSTISDEKYELSYGSGPFGVLLPSYRLDSGGTSYQDDGDTIGGIWKVEAIRRFLGTRTSFETTGFYGWAQANSSGASLGAPGDHLESNLNHYGVDVALRDTWRTEFGGLSAGLAFSYMAFDQDFKIDQAGSRIGAEDLDSDYLGGKAIFGWDGCLLGRRSKIDIGIGYFDLNVDYRFNGSATLPGSFTDHIDDYATTVDAEFTTYFRVMGCDANLTVGAMYISDIGQIVHDPPPPVPASLTSSDAVLINGMVQILF